MRERVKSGLLLALVALSIVLTGQLLFGQPSLETAAPPAYEQLVFGELRPAAAYILPELSYRNEESWQLLQPWAAGHTDAWSLLLDLLRYGSMPESGTVVAQPGGAMARAVFSVPAKASLWLPSAPAAELSIAEMAWFAAEPLVVRLRDGEGNWHYIRLSFLPDSWETQLQQAFTAGESHLEAPAQSWEPLVVAEGTTLLLPQELPRSAPYSLRQELLDTDKLLRSIFVNTALVRRIEERDGAVIYTDGQRGLRLFRHGEIEYTSPKSEPGAEVLEQNQALRRVAQYLQLMGGWPENLYLQEIIVMEQPGWNTHTVTFQAIGRGLRLVGAEPPVTLRFSDRGVIDYRRHLLYPESAAGTEREWINPVLAVEAVAAYLAGAAPGAELRQVYPALYVSYSTAQPAWIFLFDRTSVVVHGYTGQVLTALN